MDKDKIRTPAPQQSLIRLTGPLSCEGADLAPSRILGSLLLELLLGS